MKAMQFARVFQLIKTRTGTDAPYRVGILMMNGERVSGWAHPAEGNGLVRVDVDQVHLAHLTKPPIAVWLDVEAIQGVTDEGILAAALPAAGQAIDSRKDGIPETHEDTKAHDDQSKVQSL
jgi:hypothetical protein